MINLLKPLAVEEGVAGGTNRLSFLSWISSSVSDRPANRGFRDTLHKKVMPDVSEKELGGDSIPLQLVRTEVQRG